MNMKTLPLSAGSGARVRTGGREGAEEPEPERCFFIANSADLGYHKDEEEFWVRIRERTNWVPQDCLLLVDDFGANEAAGDHYGRGEEVAARRQRATEVLKKVFAGPVEIMPFILSGDEAMRREESRLIIGSITAKIRDYLRGGGRAHV
jgi:hypothetical protein